MRFVLVGNPNFFGVTTSVKFYASEVGALAVHSDFTPLTS